MNDEQEHEPGMGECIQDNLSRNFHQIAQSVVEPLLDDTFE